jgi:hypothetical protein
MVESGQEGVTLIRSKLVIRFVPACVLAAALCFAQQIPDRLTESSEATRMEEARRRAVREDLRRLHERMEHFVAAWNEFIREYADRGTFNLKKARTTTEAWRKLEREETWPKK